MTARINPCLESPAAVPAAPEPRPAAGAVPRTVTIISLSHRTDASRHSYDKTLRPNVTSSPRFVHDYPRHRAPWCGRRRTVSAPSSSIASSSSRVASRSRALAVDAATASNVRLGVSRQRVDEVVLVAVAAVGAEEQCLSLLAQPGSDDLVVVAAAAFQRRVGCATSVSSCSSALLRAFSPGLGALDIDAAVHNSGSVQH